MVQTLNNLTRSKNEEIVVEINGDADGLAHFISKGAGKVKRCVLYNGVQACDGTNGYEIIVENQTDSAADVGYFGYGSGTEAAKATDKVDALGAYYSEEDGSDHIIASTISTRFNKGDFLTVTVDRDGIAVRGKIVIELDYDGVGRS
jgi:hypothetical protein